MISVFLQSVNRVSVIMTNVIIPSVAEQKELILDPVKSVGFQKNKQDIKLTFSHAC
jgi:hypothetical protein